jgi:hypothetical protein
VLIDRVVVRFSAPEMGGITSPSFIFERVLAFEARLEALSDPDQRATASESYRERYVNAALERHIAETLLSSLHIEPEPTEQELAAQADAARLRLLEQVGGPTALSQAQLAEGISSSELGSILRRRARASLYLDRMVAPMLQPSQAELRTIHRTAVTPFRSLDFGRAEPALRRWYVGRRLSAALGAFYQNARSRIRVTLLGKPAS